MKNLNLKCLFSGHNWVHGSEIVTLLSIPHRPHMNVTDNIDTRYCLVCSKKERKAHDVIGNEFWVEHKLSKEELRDKKLKQLIG